MNDMDRGIYSKYIVTKADGTPLDGDCFVLRPDRDPAAVKALLAYAASTPNEELSSDIRIWLASIGADMGEPDEIAALRAEVEQYEVDIKAGNLVRLPGRLIAPYELNDRYWICGWDSERCTLIIQDRALLNGTARIEPEGCRYE